MKGFVPVKKNDLRDMAEMGLAHINAVYPDRIALFMEEARKRDAKRSANRRLFGILPRHKQLFSDESTFQDFVKGTWTLIGYDSFYSNPFKRLETRYDRAIYFYSEFLEMALNGFAGEPILISLDDFQMLSNPDRHSINYVEWRDLL
jgi:hypothetical protein